MDLSRLAKLLALSASPVDAEALAAIRAAHAMLASANIGWSAVLALDPERSLLPRDPVEVGGRLLPPPLDTWAATARFLASIRAGRSQREQFRLDVLCVRLLAGEPPSPDDAALLVAIYACAAGQAG